MCDNPFNGFSYLSVIEQLNGKQLVMQLLGHDDPNVRYEALLAVQKLMVHNWEYLGKRLSGVPNVKFLTLFSLQVNNWKRTVKRWHRATRKAERSFQEKLKYILSLNALA
jgi:hypothetical protein